MSKELDEIVKDSNYLFSFGYSKVTLLVEVESRMNYDKIYFNHNEIYLNYCNEVFRYCNQAKIQSYSDCARQTGISYHTVREIFKKYIDKKE